MAIILPAGRWDLSQEWWCRKACEVYDWSSVFVFEESIERCLDSIRYWKKNFFKWPILVSISIVDYSCEIISITSQSQQSSGFLAICKNTGEKSLRPFSEFKTRRIKKSFKMNKIAYFFAQYCAFFNLRKPFEIHLSFNQSNEIRSFWF